MVTVDDFQRQVFSDAYRSAICDSPVIELSTKRRIKIHIDLFVGGFVEAYYNQQTETVSYVLIRNGQRVFSADNTGGWHLHPFDDPSAHMPTTDGCAVLFAEFLDAIDRQTY